MGDVGEDLFREFAAKVEAEAAETVCGRTLLEAFSLAHRMLELVRGLDLSADPDEGDHEIQAIAAAMLDEAERAARRLKDARTRGAS